MPAVKPDFAQMTLDKRRLVHNQPLSPAQPSPNGSFWAKSRIALIFNDLFLAKKAGNPAKRYTPLAVSRVARALSTKLSTEIVDKKISHFSQAG